MSEFIKKYVVNGNPIALARARNFHGRFYDAQKNLKVVWGIDLRRQHDDAPFFNGPILMDVVFYLPIPKTATAKRVSELKNQWHIIKPDSSNLLKFVEDVATSICYRDDCIIAKHTITKVYDDGNGPRTEFILSLLKPRE